MDFTADKQEKYTLVSLKEEKLDSQIAPTLKSEFVVINSEGVKNIILDLSDTRYTDSSGLSAILVANRICKSSGGTFVLAGLQESVAKLINISQLDSVLNITPTVKEAVDFVFMDEVEKDIGGE